MQISNYVYCDDMFESMDIEHKILPCAYKDYPYFLVKDFLSQDLCKQIVDYCKEQEEIDNKAKIKKQVELGYTKPKLNEDYRKTNVYELSDDFKTLYSKRFYEISKDINSFFNVSLTFSTDVQVLEYKKGFFYKKHADDSNELIDKDRNTIGFVNVAPQRKITTVLFGTTCNKDTSGDYYFSGGELIFNHLFDKNMKQIKIEPKAGDMLVFPSNPYFCHEVLPVLSGYRLTLVQWHDAIIN